MVDFDTVVIILDSGVDDKHLFFLDFSFNSPLSDEFYKIMPLGRKVNHHPGGHIGKT